MNTMTRVTSPLMLALLAACAGPPPTALLSLTPEQPTTTDDIVLAIADNAELDEDAEISYTIAWYRDGEAVGGLDGATTVPAAQTAKGESWRAEVITVDDKERVSLAVDLVVTVINTAPTATVEAGPESASTSDDLVATVTGVDVDDDGLTYSWSWKRDGQDAGIDSDTVPADQTNKGEVWTVSVTPNDGETDGEAAEATVGIENTIPVADSVQIGPAEVYEDTTITATATGTDEDGDDLDWNYLWSVNGVEVPDVDGDSLDGKSFDKGDTISVEATPNDGDADGNTVESDEIVVLNTAPSAEKATIDPAEATELTTLTCTGSGWYDMDGDTEDYRIGWEVNGTLVGTGATLDGANFDKTDSVVCMVTPWDGEEEGKPISSAAVTIDNTPPVLADATISPSSPKEGDTLSVKLGTASDIDGDDITYSYVWTVDGKSVGTKSTLGSGDFGKGNAITVTVTPNDGDENGASVTSAKVVVINTAPEMTSANVTPKSPRTDSMLTAAGVAKDIDGDKITFKYAWLVNGKKIGPTAKTLFGKTNFSKGDSVLVEITPNDGDTNGKPMRSSAVKVLNTKPSIAAATIGPAKPSGSTPITCGATGWTDADNDKAGYRYQWQKSRTEIKGATAQVLPASYFKKGDKIRCVVTPWDGEETGTSRTSAELTVVNSLPTIASVTLSPSSPKTNDLLTARVSASDGDGDRMTYIYQWYRDSGLFLTIKSTATSYSISGKSYFNKNHKLYVRVTANDGSGNSAPRNSSIVTVANSAPVVTTSSVSPGTLYTNTTARASYAATDADGDRLGYTFAWYVNGRKVSTSSALSSGYIRKGYTVYVVVTASDGTATNSRTSSTITVRNTVPTTPAVAISPTSPKDAENLVCKLTRGATDLDGDKISYDFDWYRNGRLWTGRTTKTGYTGDTIYAADTTVGHTWQCYAAGYDGTSYGTDGKSAVVTIVSGFTVPKVGTLGTAGRISGNNWKVCRADTKTAWVAANTGGKYDTIKACKALGYTGANAKGGTCGTVCGYCRTAGREYYDGGGGAYTSLGTTVHWRCYR
jgi:hypothetical protein